MSKTGMFLYVVDLDICFNGREGGRIYFLRRLGGRGLRLVFGRQKIDAWGVGMLCKDGKRLGIIRRF
jgi:hypothetical protein